ncbi:MAG: transporter ATP-binding protein [Myxococcaceae bacterium]|nr:transporter ATP-binding protein [Myxococcaceae bacterium]
MHTGPLLEVRALTKRYGGFTAVDELDLSVARGEMFGLLGVNGAGKTTTMRMLMGILRASSGSARVDGLDCFLDRVEVKRRVGYLPDEPAFQDYLRGGEIVRFVGQMHGLSGGEIERRSAPLVERLSLGDAMDEFAVNYSRGMKKKLALVCALLHEPLLLILDEPTSGLDPIAMRRLDEVLRARVNDGMTVLLSSHQLEHVQSLCGRIAIMSQARLAAVGTLPELRARASAESSLEDVFFAVTESGNAES